MQAEGVLHELVQRVCPDMHKRRRESLVTNTASAMRERQLSVTQLGRGLRSDAKEKHCIKRADRLLSNRYLHSERVGIYARITQWLIGSQERVVIIIDWSDLDSNKRHFLLRASIPVDGRSMTLYEEVHTKETNERPAAHRGFLRTLGRIVPHTCRPIVVTDAGFRTRWFTLIEEMGWDWVGRIRNRHWVEVENSGLWYPCKSWYEEATGRPKTLGEAKLTWQHAMPCRLVLYKGKPKGRIRRNQFATRALSSASEKKARACREPWLLATSLPKEPGLAREVVNLYRLRMQIEESFRDLKSLRFGLGLELQRTYQVERLQVLLLIATLALLAAWVLGTATQHTGQHWQYQANTVKNRVVLSVIFLGLCVVNDHRVRLSGADITRAQSRLPQDVARPSSK